MIKNKPTELTSNITRRIYCIKDSNIDEHNVHIPLETSGMHGKEILRKLKTIITKNFKDSNLLEASSYSDTEIGRKLSAFNLTINTDDLKKLLSSQICGTIKFIDTPKIISIESLYQGSKVIEGGRALHNLYNFSALEAKRAASNYTLTKGIVGYNLFGLDFPHNPPEEFYDFLYLCGIYFNHSLLNDELLKYNIISDVAFNPLRGINTQARALAKALYLYKKGGIDAIGNYIRKKMEGLFMDLNKNKKDAGVDKVEKGVTPANDSQNKIKEGGQMNSNNNKLLVYSYCSYAYAYDVLKKKCCVFDKDGNISWNDKVAYTNIFEILGTDPNVPKISKRIRGVYQKSIASPYSMLAIVALLIKAGIQPANIFVCNANTKLLFKNINSRGKTRCVFAHFGLENKVYDINIPPEKIAKHFINKINSLYEGGNPPPKPTNGGNPPPTATTTSDVTNKTETIKIVEKIISEDVSSVDKSYGVGEEISEIIDKNPLANAFYNLLKGEDTQRVFIKSFDVPIFYSSIRKDENGNIIKSIEWKTEYNKKGYEVNKKVSIKRSCVLFSAIEKVTGKSIEENFQKNNIIKVGINPNGYIKAEMNSLFDKFPNYVVGGFPSSTKEGEFYIIKNNIWLAVEKELGINNKSRMPNKPFSPARFEILYQPVVEVRLDKEYPVNVLETGLNDRYLDGVSVVPDNLTSVIAEALKNYDNDFSYGFKGLIHDNSHDKIFGAKGIFVPHWVYEIFRNVVQKDINLPQLNTDEITVFKGAFKYGIDHISISSILVHSDLIRGKEDGHVPKQLMKMMDLDTSKNLSRFIRYMKKEINPNDIVDIFAWKNAMDILYPTAKTKERATNIVSKIEGILDNRLTPTVKGSKSCILITLPVDKDVAYVPRYLGYKDGDTVVINRSPVIHPESVLIREVRNWDLPFVAVDELKGGDNDGDTVVVFPNIFKWKNEDLKNKIGIWECPYGKGPKAYINMIDKKEVTNYIIQNVESQQFVASSSISTYLFWDDALSANPENANYDETVQDLVDLMNACQGAVIAMKHSYESYEAKSTIKKTIKRAAEKLRESEFSILNQRIKRPYTNDLIDDFVEKYTNILTQFNVFDVEENKETLDFIDNLKVYLNVDIPSYKKTIINNKNCDLSIIRERLQKYIINNNYTEKFTNIYKSLLNILLSRSAFVGIYEQAKDNCKNKNIEFNNSVFLKINLITQKMIHNIIKDDTIAFYGLIISILFMIDDIINNKGDYINFIRTGFNMKKGVSTINTDFLGKILPNNIYIEVYNILQKIINNSPDDGQFPPLPPNNDRPSNPTGDVPNVIPPKNPLGNNIGENKKEIKSTSVNNTLCVFSDGGYDVKKNCGGWGFVVYDKSSKQVIHNESGMITPSNKETDDGYYIKTRNIIGEFRALFNALNYLKSIDLTKYNHIEFYVDYVGTVKWIKGEWKANKDVAVKFTNMVKNLIATLNINIKFYHVPSHDRTNGCILNELVDRLCTAEMNESIRDKESIMADIDAINTSTNGAFISNGYELLFGFNIIDK